MKILCPKCGKAISGEDIDLTRAVGVCRPCGELVPFPAVVTPFAPSSNLASTPGARLYKPASFKLAEQVVGERYEATITPSRLAALPLLGFCLVWNTFMAVWYGIAIAGGVWMMGVFGLIHLGAGLFMTHKALVGLFNTHRLVLANGVLSWKSSPVPVRGSLSLPYTLVDGFAVKETNGSRSTSYSVAVNLADGTMREIDVGATDRATADYAVESFQEALRIAKQPVQDAPYRG